MAKIRKIETAIPQANEKKKVAAYTRVSMESDRLNHSLAAQVSYYSALIQENPDWEYAGVYADAGISGTGMRERNEFQRLISDCELGKIDIILTKSISRFARNTVDLLNVVRRLKELGIEVRFEKENINSLSEDGELMLSLLASFAQEESRSISENVKWGIRKRFESGESITTNKHILGYRYDETQRKYAVIPEEAEIIRKMFELYLDGVSLQKICDELNESGHRTVNGCLFQEGSVGMMVANEVYAGDTLRQKSYVVDPISKSKVKNRGELPMYYIMDTHESIIDRETWEKVQKESERRKALLPPTYCFTGKIKCGVCGGKYTRRTTKQKGKTYVLWLCRGKIDKSGACISKNFSEKKLKEICAEALGTDGFSEEEFNSRVLCLTTQENGDIEFNMVGGETILWKNLHINESRHIPTVTDRFKGKLFCGACGKEYRRMSKAGKWSYWCCAGKNRKENRCTNPNHADYELRNISAYVLEQEEFDESDFDKRIEKVTVQPDGSLLYFFYDGRVQLWQR